MSDENEVVVISHPIPKTVHPVTQAVMRHVHHDREVICKKDAADIVIGPIHADPMEVLGHEQSYHYVRTEERDSQGRAIFKRKATE